MRTVHAPPSIAALALVLRPSVPVEPGQHAPVTVREPPSKIEPPGLCRALFDVSLGEDPTGTRGKRTVVGRLPASLAREDDPPTDEG